jgi:DHA2 family multidrug resistance protein
LLDKGQQEDWFGSHLIVWMAIAAVAGLGFFIFRELRDRHPLVNLRVFRIRTYTTGVFLMTVLGFVLYGSMVLLPVFLQTLLGYSALDAGVAMLPRGLGSFIAMPFVGFLMSKVEPRKLLAVGLSVAAFSFWDLARINLNAGYWDIFWPQFIQGLSMGFIFVPLTTATHDPIPKEQMGNATSIFNVMRNIGGSVGIAMVTTLYARRTQGNINRLGENINALNSEAANMIAGTKEMFMSRGMDAVTATKQAYAAVFGMVQQQASMVSFIQAFRMLAVLFICCVPLIYLMKKPKRGGGGAMMH